MGFTLSLKSSQSGLGAAPGRAHIPGLSPPCCMAWTLKVNRDLTQSSESEPRGCLLGLTGDRLSFFAAGRDPGELMAAIMGIVGHLLLRGASLKIEGREASSGLVIQPTPFVVSAGFSAPCN